MFLIIWIGFGYPFFAFTLTYNDACTNKCDQPGMICENNRCVCNVKSRLFWTGARCMPCESDWSMSETACVALYQTEMSWESARLICRDKKAELISFRRQDIVSLIYKLQTDNPKEKLVTGAWTSAKVSDFDKGIYKWLDTTMRTFTAQDAWWCKKNTPNLGYTYPYDEPTRYYNNTQHELCVMYWRSNTNTQVVCLDDQQCDRPRAFVCEKSESTALQYLGPPATQGQPQSIGNSKPGSVVNPEPKKDKSNKLIIIIIVTVVVLLLLIALLLGLFCFCKHKRQSHVTRNSKASIPTTRQSAPTTIIESRSIPEQEIPVSGINNLQKLKNNRAGYSKQQFDEFD